MSRDISWTAVAVVVASMALGVAACGSDATPPRQSTIPASITPASIAPAPSVAASAESTPATSPTRAAIRPGSWVASGSLVRGRSYGTTATVLRDGRVLVTGGDDESGGSATAAAEVYDPATGVWSRTRNMLARRRGHVAVLLQDGRVLVTGGWNYNEVPPRFGELYDPSAGTWTKTSPMTRWRDSPTGTTLADGRVLVAGGWTACGCSTRRAEIFDPIAGTWTATRGMIAPSGLATLLADGRVLVVSQGQPAQAFEPTSGRWRQIANAPVDVGWNAAVRLENGDVLLLATQLAKGELYDPIANTWTSTDLPHTGRGPAVLLDDGTVLVVGKVSSARFDPATGFWTAVPRPPLIRDYALDSIDGVEVNLIAKLRDGRVLATEGGSAAIYDPAAGAD